MGNTRKKLPNSFLFFFFLFVASFACISQSSLFSYKKNGLFGYMNDQGYSVIPNKYQAVNEFSGDYACVKQDGAFLIIDRSGKIKLVLKDATEMATISEDMIVVKKIDGYSILKINGELVADKLFSADQYSEGYAVVKKGEFSRYQYIRKDGSFIPQVFNHAYRFSEGLCVTFTYDRMEVFNRDFKKVISKNGISSMITGRMFSNGMLQVMAEGSPNYMNMNYLNNEGNFLLKKNVSEAYQFSDGVAWIIEGMFVVSQDIKLRTGSTVKLINIRGETLMETDRYSWFGQFSDGLAPVKYKDTSKYAFITKEGKNIFDMWFLDAKPFCNGLAYIKTEEGEGYVNIKGQIFYWKNVK